jgi:hypothetical protein
MARTTEEVSNFVSRLHSQTISQRLGTALNIDVKTVGAKPILRDYFNFCMFVRWAYCNRAGYQKYHSLLFKIEAHGKNACTFLP